MYQLQAICLPPPSTICMVGESPRSNSLEGYGNESEKGFHLKLVASTDVPFSVLIESQFRVFTRPSLFLRSGRINWLNHVICEMKDAVTSF